MVLFGLAVFYSIRIEVGTMTEAASMLRMLKHSGTFVGLMGIGVGIAGVLLHLIGRNQPPVID